MKEKEYYEGKRIKITTYESMILLLCLAPNHGLEVIEVPQ